MAITYVIKFDVKPDKCDAFASLLACVSDAMRHAAMFHQAILHRDPESEHQFMLCETWESYDDAVNVQLKRPTAMPGMWLFQRFCDNLARSRSGSRSAPIKTRIERPIEVPCESREPE